ncbi:MAG TPA: hypothetical protein VL333_13120 [Candidatus Saccharimonadales bacterium]|jgi:hypothetical protein|nr:hypothetical protein [Candidatus Saccharimonadales bacterium]
MSDQVRSEWTDPDAKNVGDAIRLAMERAIHFNRPHVVAGYEQDYELVFSVMMTASWEQLKEIMTLRHTRSKSMLIATVEPTGEVVLAPALRPLVLA